MKRGPARGIPCVVVVDEDVVVVVVDFVVTTVVCCLFLFLVDCVPSASRVDFLHDPNKAFLSQKKRTSCVAN
jgi:hypothetical protein